MGLAGYCMRFIAGFLRIAHPITSLQRKGVKLIWIEECEKSFQQLKKLLTNAPILNITDPDEEFMVFIDAWKEGLGVILNQNGFVICFESKKLKCHERLYATHDLELESIVHTLKKLSRTITIIQAWRKKLQSTSPNVWSVKGLKLSIDTQLGCYNYYPFLRGSGKWWQWISSQDYPEQTSNMIPSWWWWISLLRLPTLFQ